MAGEDLRISVVAQLDEPLSFKILQEQLNNLAKNLKLNISIDTKPLKEFEATYQKIQNQINKQSGKGNGLSIFDKKDEENAQKVYTSVKQAVEEFEKFGTVKVNKDFIDPLTGEVKAFTLAINKGEGEVEKLKFKLAELANVKGLPEGSFIAVKGSSSDNTQAVELKNSQIAAKQEQDLIEQMETFRLQSIQRRQQEERQWNQTQQIAIQKNGEIERQEIAKTQQARQSYENWWQRAIAQRDQNQRQSEQKTIDSLDEYKRKAEIQATGLLNNKNKILSPEQVTQLNNYLASVKGLNAQTPNLTSRMQELSLDFKEVSANAQQASMHSMSFGESFKTAISKFSIWIGASTLFFQSLHFITDGIAFINDLNKSLTEISIVTGKSQESVAALGREYNELAKQMGVLTGDIASASVEFYRQGLSQEQVMKRTKVATEYAKIAGLDFKTSAEIVTATVNSMKVDVERATDVFAYLGDATATGKYCCPLLQ